MRSRPLSAGGKKQASGNLRLRSAPFISVAFTAGLFFVPVVIMTGLATDPRPFEKGSAEPALSDLRGTIEGFAPNLRPTED